MNERDQAHSRSCWIAGLHIVHIYFNFKYELNLRDLPKQLSKAEMVILSSSESFFEDKSLLPLSNVSNTGIETLHRESVAQFCGDEV